MASVRVAVRLRPLNKREIDMESKVVVDMADNKTRILNFKMEHSLQDLKVHDKWKEFTFDHSYWTVDRNSPKYASQEQVFNDLGMDVVENAYEGYNACVFAYGQTGSGKTYTMMGNPGDEGLIPRICFELFSRMKDESMTYRAEVSYLEIYNEKVRDLLKTAPGGKPNHSLRVREHPKNGPYVQDLSKHLVQNFTDIKELMTRGSESRTTASTSMNDVSSRSHAIFTIVFTQAKFSKESPLETHSKIHLVDLAGSERADATGATGQRLKEGGSINKSLVTLGNVISTLADLSSKASHRRNIFIPYRDSVLTWLLKDSLGGNSKTIMIATLSPAQCNYAETLSTLRYANRAKDIINKPTVNEDPNVKLIRELRAEIARLNTLLGGNIDSLTTPKVKEKLHENEAKIKVLTEQWAGRWTSVANILEEEKSLALRKEGLGVVLDSQLPHLIGIDDDLLSTGIMLYHLKEGVTSIGSDRGDPDPDIVLQGPDIEPEHCIITFDNGDVTLIPGNEAPCSVNGQPVTEATPLVQGAVILMGQTNMFRFNHPAQAAKLKKEFKGAGLSLSRYSLLSQSMSDLCRSTDNLAFSSAGDEYEMKYAELLEQLEGKRQEVSLLEDKFQQAEKERVLLLNEKERDLDTSRQRLTELESGYEIQAETEQASDLNLEEEKVRLRELIRTELSQLLQAETRRIAEAQAEREALEQELAEMRRKHEEEKQSLGQERVRLEAERETLSAGVQEKEARVTAREAELRHSQQVLSALESEQTALQQLQTNFNDFDTLASHLSEEVTSQLHDAQLKLASQQNNIQDQERRNFEEFTREKKDILSNKAQVIEDIEKEREQLVADTVCADECGQNLLRAFQNGEMEQEKFDRENAALEVERQRIQQETENLDIIEKENENITAADLEKLNEKRASQIEVLNEDRDQLKSAIKEWENLVGSVTSSQSEELRGARDTVTSVESSLSGLKAELENERAKVGEELTEIDQHIQQVVTSEEACAAAWAGVYEQHEARMRGVQQRLEQYVQRILERRHMLESVDIDAITSATELRKLCVLLGLNTVTMATQAAVQSPHNDLQLQQIVTQEAKVKDGEDDLENVKVECEIARERDLDALDSERYQLRQLEEQERINALVDQEMRKRAFEERVEREKQRRIERERERAERDRELAKIKRAHEKELHRMQEKIEESGMRIENTPTRANPYASVMSGDATPVSGSGNARKVKSKSMTNLARTQSITSLTSGGTTSKPIKLCVPGYVARGAGLNTHVDYEVKIWVLDEAWVVYRRYSRFRELHNDIKHKFPEVNALVFPPKRWFGNRSEKVAAERRILLEVYLSHVIDILQRDPRYPLHPAHARIYSKQVLCDFHPFFKKGVFENSQHGTS